MDNIKKNNYKDFGLNYADFILIFLKIIKKKGKFFKTQSIIKSIILDHLKVNKDTILFTELKESLKGKSSMFLSVLKKYGYIKKYNTRTWEKLKEINPNDKINIFAFSKRKNYIIEIFKNSKKLSIRDLSKKMNLSRGLIKMHINQINKEIPGLLEIREKNKNTNLYSINSLILKKCNNIL